MERRRPGKTGATDNVVSSQVAAALQLAQARLPDLRAVILLGSRASRRARPDSDIDLAVLCDRQVDRGVLFDLAGDISAMGTARADLVDLRSPHIPAILRRDILLLGRVLTKGADDLIADEQIKAMGAFQEHHEATAEIRPLMHERLRSEARLK